MHFKNIYIFNKLSQFIIILNNYNNIIKPIPSYNIFPEQKIIVGENLYENYNILRIWKSNTILNKYFNDMNSGGNLIGCLDYKINKDNIKIEYLSVSDNFDNNIAYLKENEAIDLKNAMIQYLENIAKTKNINKLIIDVNEKLKYYNYYYKDSGFILTKRRCCNNPFWLECEKIIK